MRSRAERNNRRREKQRRRKICGERGRRGDMRERPELMYIK